MDGSQHTDDPLNVGWRDKPPTLKSFVGMVRRQAAVVIAFITAGIVLALLLIVFAEPLYTARVSLYLDADGGSSEPRSDVATAIDLDTNVELIRSDDTVATVIRSLDLVKEPEFAPDQSSLNLMFSNLRTGLGLVPPSTEIADQLPAVILKVRSGLQVTRNGNSRMIDLRYTSKSPALAVAIANAFASAHFASISAREEHSIERRIARLDIRASNMRQKASEVGARIRADLRQSGLGTTDPKEFEGQISTLRQQVSALEAKIAALSAKLSLLTAYEQSGDVSAIAVDTPESRRLLAELAAAEERLVEIRLRPDAAPQLASATEGSIEALRENLRQEIRLAAKAIEVERGMAMAERDNIAGQIAQLSDYLASDSWAELETARQEKILYDGMYQDYLTQLEGAGRERQNRPDLRIVADALTPTVPSSPNIKVILAIAMTLAAFIGICIAALREWNRHERSGT